MPFALITGASSGIGAVFARRLAALGYDLALVARRAGRLEALAAELRGDGAGRGGACCAAAPGGAAGVPEEPPQAPRGGEAADCGGRVPGVGRRVEAIPLDLALPDADARLAAELARRGAPAVDWLVNNAGFGYQGPVADADPARQAAMIQVNAAAVAALTRRFLPPMLARGAGVIINVASTAAFQPVPYLATYAATKAFVLSFTEALAEEVAGSGVRVLCLCPGPTPTEFFEAAGMEPRLAAARMTPVEAVVDAALRGVETGRRVVIPGTVNAVLARASRLAPRRLVTRLGARIMKPRGAPRD